MTLCRNVTRQSDSLTRIVRLARDSGASTVRTERQNRKRSHLRLMLPTSEKLFSSGSCFRSRCLQGTLRPLESTWPSAFTLRLTRFSVCEPEEVPASRLLFHFK